MNLLHKIYAICLSLLAGALLLSVAGCNSIFDYEDNQAELDDSSYAFLKINVDLLESIERTKGDDEIEDPLLPNEKMHTLRIVILHNDGTVEIDKYLTFSDPAMSTEGTVEEGELLFRVKSNERKRVYLFANEEQLTGLQLDDKNFSEEAVKNYVWTGAIDGSKPLPQSAVYNLVVPSSAGTISKTYHLVRTMTKFSFFFESSRPMKLTIDELEVSSLADQSYLLPHFYEGEKPVLNSADYMFKDMFWIDWLKETSERSHYISQMDKLDWIYDYNLPEGTSHSVFKTEIVEPLELSPSKTETLEFYAHESKYIPAGETAQQYAINKLTVTDYSISSAGDKITFDLTDKYKEALQLPQVKALFRNTHVIVRVIFGANDLYVYARIMPWNDWKTEGYTPPYDKLIEIVD